jgi:hypothetical protein
LAVKNNCLNYFLAVKNWLRVKFGWTDVSIPDERKNLSKMVTYTNKNSDHTLKGPDRRREQK